MIPAVIHQIWNDSSVPERLAAYTPSWHLLNPSWRRILWTDRMRLDFVAENYPELLETYCTYANPICRADAARYMLLHKFGGLYADIDVECLAPLASLESESRVILCHEPPVYWSDFAPRRGHPFVLFNGVMASPAAHPFWRKVLDQLPRTRHGTSVIDITGPCLLTAAYLGYSEKDSIAVHSCHLFTPTDKSQRECPPYGEPVPCSLTRHYWAGTWTKEKRRHRIGRRLVTNYHLLRYGLTRGSVLDRNEAQNRVDGEVLSRPPPDGDRVAMLVPVSDAGPQLDAFVEAISDTDVPKEKTKLVFCEADSVDGSRERLMAHERLMAIAPGLRQSYRDVVLLKKDVGNRVEHGRRSDPITQRLRLARIAAVRNHLIDHGLDETDDWAFWIDVNIWRFTPDIFQRLRSVDARIIVPHCVRFFGGPTCDLSSFLNDWTYPKNFYYRHVHHGLFQPPRSAGRLYLDSFRHSEQIELDSVGGATLLVDAGLHRGGLRFPEIPYRDLVDTEAFGALARDLGIRLVGLPNVEVLHIPGSW